MGEIRKSVLDNCGRYSDDLNEISRKVVERKKFNGEKITELDMQNIDDELFQAYQTILSNLNDGNSISRAVKMMRTTVENSGVISNFNTVAISAIETARKEQPTKFFQENNIKEVIGGAIVANELINQGDKTLDKIFNEKTLQEMNVVLEKAKTGDIDAVAEMETVKKATKFMSTHQKLEGNIDRAALAWMARLSKIDSPMARDVLNQMAEQYKDVLDVTERKDDGTLAVSYEKIEKALEERVSAEKMENIDYDSINKRTADRAIQKGEYSQENAPKDAKSVENNLRKESRISTLNKLIKEYRKSENCEEKISELCGQYPEEMKQILRREIDVCNRIQESGKGYKKLSEHQNTVIMVSNAIREREEQAIDNGKKVEMNTRTQDDGR